VTLTPQDRAKLDRAIGAGRQIIESDLRRRAEGEFGLVAPKEVQPEGALALSPDALNTRRQLVDVVQHLRQSDGDESGPVGRLLREASFTLLNRLVAVRVAEARGLLPPALAEGPRSRGYQDLLELFPLLREEPTGGYWTFLRLCADDLARDAPVLFDPRNPLLALEPSAQALTEVVDVLADTALRGIWKESDAFGWTYQFFNRPEERLAMREESAAPRNSRELAVRNQFFSPRYVVDFLVHNTLGRRLVETGLGDELAQRLPLYVPDDSPRSQPLNLEEARVLDPAVGSGHFLLGCYDVLETAWDLCGVPAEDAAPRIVDALWGIDIDARCAQVAAAAIAIRARRRQPEGELPRPHVFTARALPDDPTAWAEALSELDDDDRRLVRRIHEVLEDAPVLGPLLKVDEALVREIQAADPTADLDETRLFAGVAADAFGLTETAIMNAIRGVATRASATPAERLLAAEATDAIGFVEAMRQRYDAVLMNPPFGDPVPETKDYIRAAYPWIPTRDSNLFAAFVGRGLELCNENGLVGAISSRTGFFLKTYERWRREVILKNSLRAFVDLGSDVMQGALVEAAAYTIARSDAQSTPAVFFRLLKETDRASALRQAVADVRDSGISALAIRVSPSEFQETAGAAFAYWDPTGIRPSLADMPAIGEAAALVRVGLQTSDDFRFIRAWWEIDPHQIAQSREETFDRRWVPCAKGGQYSPYYSDIHLVVDWAEDGKEIRDFDLSVTRNAQHYFMSGLTWVVRTVSAFATQVLPEGTIFTVRGPLCRPRKGIDPFALMGWLNGRLVRWAIEVSAPAGEETKKGGTAARDYGVGVVQRLAWLGDLASPRDLVGVASHARAIAEARAQIDENDETTRRFVLPGVLRANGRTLVDRVAALGDAQLGSTVDALDHHAAIDDLLLRTLPAHGAELSAGLDDAVGSIVARLPDHPLSAEQEKSLSW
jgi:Eco57I restriction-modification methylase